MRVAVTSDVAATPVVTDAFEQLVGRYRAGQPFYKVFEDTFVAAAEQQGLPLDKVVFAALDASGITSRTRNGVEVDEFTAQAATETIAATLVFAYGYDTKKAMGPARSLLKGKNLSREAIESVLTEYNTVEAIDAKHSAVLAKRKEDSQKVTVEDVAKMLRKAHACGIDVAAIWESMV